MAFPVFEHAAFLDAGHDVPHYLGSSAFWRSRPLPAPDGAPAAGDMLLATPVDAAAALAAFWSTTPERIRLTSGTTGANTATLLAALSRHRDRSGSRPANVVVESPVYQPLVGVARGLGVDVRLVPRDAAADGWGLAPDAVADACDGGTALVILSSPHNPTGQPASAADLDALDAVAAAHDAWLLVDQVYQPLTDHVVAADERRPSTVSSSGFNKTFGAASLRTGWLAAAPEVATAIHDAHVLTHLSPPAAGVATGLALLREADACRQDLAQRLASNHAVYHAWLAATPGVHDAVAAAGDLGITGFPALAGVSDTVAWCRAARDVGVLALPGEFFDCPGHVRIGLGGDPAALPGDLAALADQVLGHRATAPAATTVP